MKSRELHSWDLPPEDAEQVQSWLATLAGQTGGRPTCAASLSLIGGAAVSGRSAAVVVFDAQRGEVVESNRVAWPTSLQYRRGLMAFALGPTLLRAFAQTQSTAEVAVFHAHGLAHPRRCGMATHLGLLLDLPSLGCAEKPLVGEHVLPGPQRGDWTPVADGAEVVGACVRTREGARPVYVSPGYALALEEAVEIVVRCTIEHRWPEPLRLARLAARGG